MPPAYRLGDIASAHGCFPPTPSLAGSSNVFINGRPVVRKGDALLPHACPNCPPHPRSMSAGSGSVSVNGKPVCRKGDAVGCGGKAAVGSSNVNIGG